MKNSFLSLIFFLTVSIANAQENPVRLVNDKKNDLEITEPSPGTYQIAATGPDPYLFTEPLKTDLDAGNTVLTFEYFAPRALHVFQIFFAPPIEESKSIKTELGVREGWTSFSIDLKQDMGKWGKKGDFLRLDFGTSRRYQIQMRNIRFRKPNAQEIERAANLEQKKKSELDFKIKLKSYLTTQFPSSISNVSVDEKNIEIKGVVAEAGKNLFLAEVPIYQDIVLIKTFERIYPVTAGKKDFKIIVPRYVTVADHQSDRLLSKWVVVEKMGNDFKLQSAARYADDIKSLNNLPDEKPTGKKGLGGFAANQFMEDLDSLNITSATVNMWITQMMRSKASESTIAFEYSGKTYYADKRWVEANDKTLQETAKRNIVVSSIILIDKAINCPDKEIGEIFQHPDCDPSGIYSMANMTSEKGAEYYAAAIDFIAKRYSRLDKKYGRVQSWIIHNEVDAGWVWTNMGEKDTLLFMDTYHKSMRLVQNIARKYNPHAKAFITLTHFWNWTEDKHFYLSRDLLNILLKYSAVEGDFDWGIAHHPYPESLFEPKSWLDEKADFTFDTPLITFKNIEVLNAWVKRPEAMYKGKFKRTVYLSEQGPNSKDYTPQNLNEQAASIAYLWKKMQVLDGIDAYQFHNWVDNRGEGGLRIGLRRFPDDAQDPGGKKPIWYVYRDLDTPNEDKATEFAKKIIGINNWSEVRYNKPIR
ncbi:DUF5722 domain-containing protein [Dyadobacter psychrotolerans]|uniref:DUF5722 domain-containing protein n=1 Tax=Dyadobacter psychrotolerans TaxID=2541721 RepID=A0A4R5DGQ0_9BACT|nr:DUF5722 domain-containing protein [Dyadobacter psychrotolerans]TDE11091.1 hypothetical protein E0F88_26720 [Dyadobacter psychrotolerans]